MSGLTAVDLFAGAGGATQGLRDAGFDVVAAVENDRDAAATWRLNHPGVLVGRDVREVDPGQLVLAAELGAGGLDLLKACPPCQGFSSLRGQTTPDDTRNDLVLDTLRFVRALRPRAVLVENVPGLAADHRFRTLCAGVRHAGYRLQRYLVDARDLGVPQRRRRLVVVAVRNDRGVRALPVGWQGLVPPGRRRAPMTVGQALHELDRTRPVPDPWDRWRLNSDLVGRRIRAVPVGGSRFDLPDELQLDCHRRLTAPGQRAQRVATGSYGRIRLDGPSPTMTTRCTTPACGPFIHPTEHRGLSLREAAALQTFPPDYRWSGGHDSVERQIGNAVPVWMAQALGRSVADLLGGVR